MARSSAIIKHTKFCKVVKQHTANEWITWMGCNTAFLLKGWQNAQQYLGLKYLNARGWFTESTKDKMPFFSRKINELIF